MLQNLIPPKSFVIPVEPAAFRFKMPNPSGEFYHSTIPFEQGDHNKYTLQRATPKAELNGHIENDTFQTSFGVFGAHKSTLISSHTGNNNNNDDNRNHNFKIANNVMHSFGASKSYVDDLHNYSKPRFAATWAADITMNGEESDEESDEMETPTECVEETAKSEVNLDDSGIQMMGEDKLMPDHHARRPMNAFLIFCKRHRAIVREKYPNLENRAITKILGDWWANMDVNEKACFTDLAKEYKDAFFNANPTFKWYKLPAPPLRTLNTRPSNAERSPGLDYLSFESNTSHQHSDKTDQRPGGIRNFKLADETEMGGLNHLIASHSLTDSRSHSKYVVKPDKDEMGVCGNTFKRSDRDHGYGAMKPPRISTNRTEPFCQGRVSESPKSSFKNQPSKSCNGEKHSPSASIVTSPHIDFERFVQANWAEPIEDTFTFHTQIDSPTESNKSARACKGKRYLEFINTVKVNSITKKPTKPQSLPSTPNLNTKPNYFRSSSSLDSKATQTSAFSAALSPTSKSPPKNDDAKIFDSIDFDLDGKINALTALNLDLYLLKKRDTKKKRKITTKRNVAVKGPQTIQEAKELILKRAVGSQKRKARKESITRRDVPVAPVDDLVVQIPCNRVEAAHQHITYRGISPEIASSDLFILAEVAAAVTN